jgi:PAS domain S-box-containing protein
MFGQDRSLRYTWVQNPALGLDREAILGRTDEELLGPEAAAPLVRIKRRVLETGRGERQEIRLARQEQAALYDLAVEPLRDSAGAVAGLIGVAADITARRRAEEELRQRANAFTHCMHGIALGNPTANSFLVCNPAFARMHGCTVEEILATPIRSLYAPGELGHVQDRIAEADRVGWVRYEALRRRKDGTVFPAQMDLASVRDAAGTLCCHVAAMQDISDRKAADAALRESQALLLALANSAPDPIFAKDLESRYLMVNDAVCALMGKPREAILGQDDRALSPPEVAARIIARDRAVLAAGAPQTFEDALPVQGGSGAFLEIKGPLVDARGAVRSLFGMGRDIAEQRQEQSHLLRAQRMVSLGALASGIAHDMNNVLTPILMGVEEMKELVADEDGRAVLEMMETSARRGAQTLQQLLTFARGADVPRGPTRPRRIVDEVLAFVRQTFPKNIQVYADCCDSPWMLTGNASQLHQVLTNLCLNARDAMPEGGVLSLGVDNLTLTEEEARRHPDARPGPHVMLRVADSGTGIASEELDRIFDPFFTTKPHGRGTGLGLATSLGIVRAHGGFILVDSLPGAGTTFSLCFPALAEPAGSEPPADAPREHEGHGEWVLVVDDEPPICRVAAITLRRHGYRPLTAPSVQEALHLWREHRERIAVVLTDLIMPFQDGFALMRALAAEDPSVRILAASGLATSEHVAQARALGAHAVLAKPYAADELLAALHRILRES